MALEPDTSWFKSRVCHILAAQANTKVLITRYYHHHRHHYYYYHHYIDVSRRLQEPRRGWEENIYTNSGVYYDYIM